MAVWVVLGGKYGEREQEALEHGWLAIQWGDLGDISKALTKEEMRDLVRQQYPNLTAMQLGNWARQLWDFRGVIKVGDIIVMPRKGQPTVAIGKAVSEYQYNPPENLEWFHGRRVDWINKEVSLPDGLKGLRNVPRTVFQPQSTNAESRLQSIAEGRASESADTSTDDNEILSPPIDQQEATEQQIRDWVGRQFHGHEFTRLIAAVLRAQGYSVDVAPPGPDGGIDIVAGSGPMGFDPPRICVQVKSGIQNANVNVLRELKGIIKNFGADYGLLVSWGGFTTATRNEARRSSYFNVRLWDSEAFLSALFENYDRLPSAMRAELPLKQIWVLDEPTI